jgi:DNA-binding SARP family transcriptional activator
MRSLLAYLLLHANEPVSADRLVDEVWGPDPPKTASASLQNYVSRLRRAIGADAVLSQPPGYVLRVDPERFDLARFERMTADARGARPRERAEKLRAALALWRGPALDDLAFEPFARDEVGRLEEARLAALEDCIEAELEIGHDGELVGELEHLVEHHPLRERFRAQLMRALYRAGRQADALEVFQAARDVLTDELGLEPGEELRALQQAILRQDESLGPVAEAVVEPGADRRTVTVLVCKLVGSSELAVELDPEAYRALLSRYLELVRDAIGRHGGTLDKFGDDAITAVFGVPELHEDDALRAVRAGMEAQAGLRSAEIEARVGIGTGEVHVLSLDFLGPPASIASQLEGRAPSGEVLVSSETYALVRDALRAEELEDAWLVREVVRGAPAYARRLDAPLVGRTQELERLRAAYGDARDSGRCRVVTVVGEAGIGKTRLMRELLLPIRDEARILVGRCASYGEGATYLPIAEAVRQAVSEPSVEGIAALVEGEDDAEQVARRVAELTGLAEGPGAPGEALWAVRRFVEGVARERPLVLVLDDIHWAEPTLLDLVEYLGQWAAAPVLVLCAARQGLLETRPGWGGPTSTGFVVELEPLGPDEVSRLVLGLADHPVDPDIEQRIVEQAGGNPLFAEQLFAVAAEAPDIALGRTPPSIDALLASRLNHLDPRVLAVLRRAAVVGRRFTLEELDDLAPPEAAERLGRDLLELTERGLLHAREQVFVFHHVLVRDVAYRGIPKAERAELHELAARGLDRRDGADELIGYHFEQAYRYVSELALDEERARSMALAAGERLGRAGIRAWQRADVPAAVNLLTRAVELKPDAHSLACELGLALTIGGDRARALEVFGEVIARAESHFRVRAELEHELLRSLAEPDQARILVDAAARAVPMFEVAEDERSLGRAWYCIAHVRGGFYCEYAVMEEAAERVATCYRRAGWPLGAPLEMLGLALDFGPRRVDEAISRLTELSTEGTSFRWTTAVASIWLGRLEAMRANFAVARGHLDQAKAAYRDLGVTEPLVDSCGRASAAIELAAGFPDIAEQSLRDACTFLQETHQTSVLATRGAELANALYEQGRYDEASEWVRIAREDAGQDDLDAALTRQPVEAKVHARQGRIDEAERVARATVDLAGRTDALNRRAESLLALAEVLELAGDEQEAQQHVATALGLYEQKGNVAAAARVRTKYEEPRAGLFVPDAQTS